MRCYVNWGSGPRHSDDVKWYDGETAPLGGGPMGPDPIPVSNPNDD